MKSDNSVKHELLMYLDDYVSNSILDIMFVAKPEERKNYYIAYNEISLMNLMFIFLNEYTGTDVVGDFYKKFRLQPVRQSPPTW